VSIVNAETGEVMDPVAYWHDRIRPNIEAGNAAAVVAIERWVLAGRDLIEAKSSVAHGQWLPLLERLGISTQDANRLASIASNPLLANSRRGGNLPSGVNVLAELAKVEPTILEDAIESGTVTTTTTKTEAREYARSTKRPARDIEPGDKVADDHGHLHLVTETEVIDGEVVIHDDQGNATVLGPDAVVNATPKKSGPPTKPDLGGGISHPARYSKGLIPLFHELLELHTPASRKILDPFAGVGGIHELGVHPYPWTTVGVELEPEWAEKHHLTQIGDATDLDFDDRTFGAIVTSPAYGNRLADSHNASDPETRRSYTHDLGRTLHENNGGGLQWGEAYRTLHAKAWDEALRVLQTGGLVILNMKDHIRNGVRQAVCGWHVDYLIYAHGCQFLDVVAFGAPSMKAGANAEARCTEMVFVLRKPAS
jgi:hypothetical protein